MSSARGRAVGMVGVAVLVGSWSAIWIAPRLVSSSLVPFVWLLAIVGMPCAVVAGAIAGRTNSGWWYILMSAALLSLAVLLASVAV